MKELSANIGATDSQAVSQGRGHGTKAVFGRDLHAALPAVKNARPRDGVERQHLYVGITLAKCVGSTLAKCHDHRDHYDHNPSCCWSGRS